MIRFGQNNDQYFHLYNSFLFAKIGIFAFNK